MNNQQLTIENNSNSKLCGGLRTKLLNQDRTRPLISIVTVVFNSENYLEDTIKSILNQKFNNYEYIIIDGDSQDRTLDIIRKYEYRLEYWLSESDRGIYDAMNKGILQARGEIIGILNSGDLYAPDTLQIVGNLYQQYQHNPYLVISGAMYRFDTKSQIQFKQQRSFADLEKNINIGMPINHPATFVTKELYETIGYFNPEYKICGDHDLFFRIYHHQIAKFLFTDQVLASMSMGGVSETLASLWTRTQEKIQIRKQQLNWLHNMLLSIKLLAVGYLKHLLMFFAGQKAILIKYNLQQIIKNYFFVDG